MRGSSLLAATALTALSQLPGAGVATAARAKPKPRPVTIEWVGDIALSSERGLPPGGLTGALAPVRGMLRDGDLTLGNLEGTLSVGGSSKCGSRLGAGNCYAFQAPPAYAGQLRSLGFGDLNLANNHSLDYGPGGRAQTIGALSAAGIAHDGLPGEIAIRRVAGQRIAILGFAPYLYDANLLDIRAAQALVRRARRRASLVVVIIHAGAEGVNQLHTPYGPQYYLGEDRGDARGFAHAVINAGASIVLGSGPHVIRGIERYRGRLIAYSLGNFVGYHTLGGGGVLSESAVLRVTLGPGGRVVRGRWIGIRLDGGLPRPDRSDASAQLVRTLSRQDFGRGRFAIAPNGMITAPSPRRHIVGRRGRDAW
ncbi:MAG: CapA family protein [Actinomycetota bacterium]|nr:CapA family protein [Actinomycetota bacterium]